jgi:predicted DCC family thiol-disulfide oxidoreductase YuxK
MTPYSYRANPTVPQFPDDRPIIIFDGYCVMCSSFARFILRHDKQAKYRLLPAQTPLGAALYQHFGLDPVNYETNILLQDGRAWFKSEGSLKMFQGLGFPWSLVVILRILPLAVRDQLYGFIARRRLRWFGRSEVCFLTDSAHLGRFLG